MISNTLSTQMFKQSLIFWINARDIEPLYVCIYSLYAYIQHTYIQIANEYFSQVTITHIKFENPIWK